jgi:hypothetical protein
VSKAVHAAEPLDTELVPEDSAVLESEPDALHMDTSFSVAPTPAIAVAAQAPEVQEDTTVISESDLPNHEIKTEGYSSIEEGDADQDSSPSKGFVDTEVQPEAQEQEETFNTDEADSGVAAANILSEALSSTVSSLFLERNIP